MSAEYVARMSPLRLVLLLVPACLVAVAAVAIASPPTAHDSAAAVITPTRVDGIHLGDTHADLRSRGKVGPIGPGCEFGGPNTRSARLRAPLKGQVDYTLNSPRKVTTITVTKGAKARGVGIGATIAAIKAKFPNAIVDHSTDQVFQLTVVRTPKRPKRRPDHVRREHADAQDDDHRRAEHRVLRVGARSGRSRKASVQSVWMSVSPPTRAITDNLADLIGNTPMVRLTRVAPNCGAELIAKLEAYNPAGSVKDRIGVAMIEAAEAEGRIEPGRNTIVESTSGNTGIALAFVCAAKGYDLVITMPQGMSREREKLLRLYGAEVVWVESMGGMNEAIEEAKRICRERGNCYVPNQFSNPANPEIHRRTTAEEIWRDTDGKLDVLVASVGTGGTITGCGERLKERHPGLHVVAVEPAGSPVLSGGKPGPHKIDGIGPGFVPEVLNREVIDEIVPVEDEDAIETARLCARREGVNAGISAGAAVWAAVQVGSRPEMSGKRIVAILPDSGDRYISTPFFAP